MNKLFILILCALAWPALAQAACPQGSVLDETTRQCMNAYNYVVNPPAAITSCQADSDCVIAQGICGSAAINKMAETHYSQLASEQRAASSCPYVRNPPRLRAACEAGICKLGPDF